MAKVTVSKSLTGSAPWEARYEYGNKPWSLQEKYELIGFSLLGALISFAVVFVSTLILLFVLPWIWYFLLERIKEISTAIKGN